MLDLVWHGLIDSHCISIHVMRAEPGLHKGWCEQSVTIIHVAEVLIHINIFYSVCNCSVIILCGTHNKIFNQNNGACLRKHLVEFSYE